jgi:hypothetical protein
MVNIQELQQLESDLITYGGKDGGDFRAKQIRQDKIYDYEMRIGGGRGVGPLLAT